MEALIGLRGAAGNDLGFALGLGMLDSHVQAPPSDWVAQSSFLVAGEHDERYGLCRHGSELRYRELPGRQDFQEHGFETVVDFIQFVDQQYTGPVAFERAHQGTRTKEVPTLEVRPYALPVFMLAL